MSDPYDVGPPPRKLGREFISRRLQSFAGFFFLLFLIEHLFTNSQATIALGDDGKGFIDTVNWIHSLPYLHVLEILFIALPLLVHVWWGVERIVMAKLNSGSSDGDTCSLPYTRNIAFTWQRITAVLLIIAIGLHVLYMRFLKEPDAVPFGVFHEYFVKLSVDPGLYTVAPRLNLILFDKNMIEQAEQKLQAKPPSRPPQQVFEQPSFNEQLAKAVKDEEGIELERRFVAHMLQMEPSQNEVVAMVDNVGAAFLMVLRDSYKSITLCVAYSIFVGLASYHGANGLWTFAITWGISLSERSRNLIRVLSNLLMWILIFFGLACIWGVYWINLRY